MAYRDEVDRVLRENEDIRKALAKARSDARFTAMRQVLLAFAFGLSWSVLGESAIAGESDGYCVAPPFGHGWLEVHPDEGSTFAIDDFVRGTRNTRIAIRPGKHHVRFVGRYGEHCTTVFVYDGRTSWVQDGERGTCR